MTPSQSGQSFPPEGLVSDYPIPDQLREATFAEANAWRDRFAAVAYDDKRGSHQDRYYQDTAIERVLAAVARDQIRILLTPATGTGKTFIAFQIAWKPFHSRRNLSGKPVNPVNEVPNRRIGE